MIQLIKYSVTRVSHVLLIDKKVKKQIEYSLFNINGCCTEITWHRQSISAAVD